MVAKIAEAALGVDDVEALKAADLGGKTVEPTVTDKIATIGENMSRAPHGQARGRERRVLRPQRRRARHGQDRRSGRLHRRGRGLRPQVAMHVAAVNPAALNEAELDPAVSRRKSRSRWTSPAKAASPSR
jgi:elongation factor Ts